MRVHINLFQTCYQPKIIRMIIEHSKKTCCCSSVPKWFGLLPGVKCTLCKYILWWCFPELWSCVWCTYPDGCHTVTPQAVAVTNPCHIWICPPPTCPSIHFPFFQAPCLVMFFWYCYWRCWLRSKIMFIGNSEVLMLKLIVMRALKHPLLWQLLTSSFFLLNCSTIHQLLHSCSFKSPYTMSTFEDINKFVYLYNSAQLLNIHYSPITWQERGWWQWWLIFKFWLFDHKIVGLKQCLWSNYQGCN